MEHIDRCFAALRPELNGDDIPVAEKVGIVMNQIGDLVNTLGNKRVRSMLCEVIIEPSVPAEYVFRAESILPEIVGGNVDHEIHMDEIEREVWRPLYKSQTPL